MRKRLRLTLSHLPESLPFTGLTSSSSAHSPLPPPPRSPSPPLLAHLNYPPSPPPTSASLSALLNPPKSFTEVVLSPAMRYTFASGHLEDALGRTAGELIDGEAQLARALGQFFEAHRERGVGKRRRTLPGGHFADDDGGAADATDVNAPAAAVPTAADDPLVPYPPVPPPPPPFAPPALSALERQFLTPTGLELTIPVMHHPDHAHHLAMGLPPPPPPPPGAGGQPGTTTVVLGIDEQREQLYRGMDALVCPPSAPPSLLSSLC